MDEPTDEPIPTTDEPDGPIVGWIVPPSAPDPSAEAIELWSASGIGWTSFLLGFPGGVVLAALNWRRMGRTRKAIAHLAAAVIGLWVLYVVAAPGLGLAAIAVSYYLYRAQRDDQSPFEAAGRVTGRNWGVGAAIALIATLLIFLPVVLIEAASGYGQLDHRGEVLFGTGASTGGCAPPAGLATVFGPDDPIFVSVVMRETVQRGSQVVGRVELGGETEERPVTLEPPYDCFVLGDPSMGPLDPGTYTFRYRYDGQPATPDLASGTFTITARPGASPSP